MQMSEGRLGAGRYYSMCTGGKLAMTQVISEKNGFSGYLEGR